MRTPDTRERLSGIFRRLSECFGPQFWWPGESPFEVMIGAILTQSASWHNVEMAITSLKKAAMLSPPALREMPPGELARYIHSSGYYNAKAKKLKALADWLGIYGDDLHKAFAGGLDEKRRELLGIHGIGPETADSILLYAAGKPVFVIDAYTRRIIDRVGIAPAENSYSAYQRLFTSNLEARSAYFNEYHALLVKLGKDVCRKKPLHGGCCIRQLCDLGRSAATQV
jgi:endonuclease-3 related protein